jgi:hypothetical protein
MFYKTTAVPLLLHGNESRAVKKKDMATIQKTEMNFLRLVKGVH